MDIKISLPKPNDTSGYKGIKTWLRQLELSVHHLQKSLEQLKEDGVLTDESYLMYRFPRIDLYNRECDDDGYVKVHVDEEADQMQEIEVEINTP